MMNSEGCESNRISWHCGKRRASIKIASLRTTNRTRLVTNTKQSC